MAPTRKYEITVLAETNDWLMALADRASIEAESTPDALATLLDLYLTGERNKLSKPKWHPNFSDPDAAEPAHLADYTLVSGVNGDTVLGQYCRRHMSDAVLAQPEEARLSYVGIKSALANRPNCKYRS